MAHVIQHTQIVNYKSPNGSVPGPDEILVDGVKAATPHLHEVLSLYLPTHTVVNSSQSSFPGSYHDPAGDGWRFSWTNLRTIYILVPKESVVAETGALPEPQHEGIISHAPGGA